MSKGKQNKGASSKKPAPAPVPTVSAGLLLAGVVLLAVSLGASVMLALQALGSLSLPGCGPQSACALAAASVWGTVPGLGWPTSHVGVAYFLALLVAWFAGRGRLSGWLRWVVRFAALGSVVLVFVMIAGGYLCVYCVTVHVASLAFVLLLELGTRSVGVADASARVPVKFAGVAVIATVVLVVVQLLAAAAADRQGEMDLEKSTRNIIKKDPGGVGSDPTAAPFTGRYRHGPEIAPVRVVIFSDYQCPDCKRIEGELRAVLETHKDVSFSAKQWPFSSQCNRFVSKNARVNHRNACWAARAAETAGILGGADAFYRMHYWLFDRSGSFVDQEIRDALPGLGFDPDEFLTLMQDVRTEQLVLQDIEEGMDLGLRQTPMIFINGVELLGWQVRNALPRAIEAAIASNLPALTARDDQPPKALEKCLSDWRNERERNIPPDSKSWALGPEGAAARIVIWGDYEEAFTAELDTRIRAAIKGVNARYVFRHYPINQACNTTAARTMHQRACAAAQAAEAVGRVGGNDAYWRMHEWIMSNQQSLDDASLRRAIAGIGLDADVVFATMNSPDVGAEIESDAAAGKRMGLRGVPFFWVNGKRVPYWRLKGAPLVERIIEEAAGG